MQDLLEAKTGGEDADAANAVPSSPRRVACATFLLLRPPPQHLTMPNIRLLRDIKARNVVKTSEVLRRAYLYVARNETLPAQVRHQAQLQLNSFSKYARPTTVKNRCYESGRGRGIISEFALSRVCSL
jgi:small subunit ribosomal protein S14